jgi:error-prone DNA polymerase
MGYVELSARSCFSYLRQCPAASTPEVLIQTAYAKGLKGLALSDQDGLYGIVRAHQEAKKSPGLRFLVAATLSFCDHPGVGVIVKNRQGYAKLCEWLTLKNFGEHRFEVFCQAADFTHWWVLFESEQGIQQFGANALWKVVCRFDGKDARRFSEAKRMQESGVRVVASNDVYYHHSEAKKVQDLLISIQTGVELSKAGILHQLNDQRFIASLEQMQQWFLGHHEWIAETVKVADACLFSLSELRYVYPSGWIPKGKTAQDYLVELVFQKAQWRYPKGVPTRVQDLLTHELDLIAKLRFADYFLTIFDICAFASSQNILYQGRGSAANSAVCYVLGITCVDPDSMDLLFERFISLDRAEPPDIDVDFEHQKREQVIQYIYQKYGRHHAAMVCAFGTFQKRSSFVDISKALGFASGVCSYRGLKKALSHDQQRLVLEMSQWIYGFPKVLSIHSGGFTLSSDPMTQIVPVQPAKMESRTIVQWDKNDLEALGLLKLDILALGMLTAIAQALKGAGLQLAEIPPGDLPTYELIQKADTIGVFQIESRAQMSLLPRLKPRNFYDLVIEVGILRPGPIIGKIIHPYLKRRQSKTPITYEHPVLERILGKTLGVILFQEQLMRLATELGGFTPGEADWLRRSISGFSGGTQRSPELARMFQKLMHGLLASGLQESTAKGLFEQMQGFAHYGFPESHAASFAHLVYVSCFLKRHYPVDFFCALFNAQPLGFYRMDTLVYNALAHGLVILPVSIHHSQMASLKIDAKTIRLGFSVIRGLKEDLGNQLIKQRALKPFESLADICARIAWPPDVLFALAKTPFFADQGGPPSQQVLWQLLAYQMIFSGKKTSDRGLLATIDFKVSENALFSKPLPLWQRIGSEYRACGLSTQGHPLSALRSLPAFTHLQRTSASLETLAHLTPIDLMGMLLHMQRPPTAKGMVFATLDDEAGLINLVLTPQTMQLYQEVLLYECFVQVTGVVQNQQGVVSVLVSRLQKLEAVAELFEQSLGLGQGKAYR